MMNQEDFLAELSRGAEAVTGVLDNILAETNGHENRVVEAMRYASLAGGKRVRPFLVCATAALFDVEESRALRAAAAVELIHCYSLVHDDLPAMDDDELRRGQPTCHIAFDEATAILAGDALLTKAFEVLADAKTHAEPSIQSTLVKVLARASGHEGMVGGQIIDLYAENHELDVPEITRLQRMKTGALIAVSCDIGALMGKASEEARHHLRGYSHDIGLAFQIADDLLDVRGDEAEVGKKTQKDAGAGKATFVSLLGVDEASEQAHMLSQQAQEHLAIFGEKADPLRALATFIVERRS
jgi:farnesyl diphosphate synthase